jgi:outer membrane protein insertion porin family
VLSFDWQFGEASRYQTFSISFREPWLFDTPTSFGVSLYDTKQDYYYSLRQTGGTISLGRRLKWPDDYFRADWIFRFQLIDNYSTSYLYDRIGRFDQLSITQVISRNSIDNPLFPSRGSNISLSNEFSGPPLLPGDAEYTKHLFSVDWYAPIMNSSRFALYIGSQFGAILRFRNNSYVPTIEQFWMGGTGLGMVATTALRGYDDRSIGPVDVSGNVLPGTVMEKHTAEIRFNVSLNPIPIYLLGFAEGGNVWDGLGNAEFFDLKRSAGLGARLLINPIGLLGFDYGYGFDSTNPNGSPAGWHFHFQFGKGF